MAKKKDSMSGKLKQYFLTGIFTILPLAGTYIIVKGLVGFLWQRTEFIIFQVPKGILEKLVPESLQAWVPSMAMAIGLVTILVATAMIGMATRVLIGRSLLGMMDNVINRLPVVNSIYKVIRQFISTFDPSASQTTLKRLYW